MVSDYCTFTKVDLEARCAIERIPGASPQRICRWSEVSESKTLNH